MGGMIRLPLSSLNHLGRLEGHEYPELQVGDDVKPRTFFRGCLDLMRHYFLEIVLLSFLGVPPTHIKGSHEMMNAEFQSRRSGDLGNEDSMILISGACSLTHTPPFRTKWPRAF